MFCVMFVFVPFIQLVPLHHPLPLLQCAFYLHDPRNVESTYFLFSHRPSYFYQVYAFPRFRLLLCALDFLHLFRSPLSSSSYIPSIYSLLLFPSIFQHVLCPFLLFLLFYFVFLFLFFPFYSYSSTELYESYMSSSITTLFPGVSPTYFLYSCSFLFLLLVFVLL